MRARIQHSNAKWVHNPIPLQFSSAHASHKSTFSPPSPLSLLHSPPLLPLDEIAAPSGSSPPRPPSSRLVQSTPVPFSPAPLFYSILFCSNRISLSLVELNLCSKTKCELSVSVRVRVRAAIRTTTSCATSSCSRSWRSGSAGASCS